jgi:hypothetical protein
MYCLILPYALRKRSVAQLPDIHRLKSVTLYASIYCMYVYAGHCNVTFSYVSKFNWILRKYDIFTHCSLYVFLYYPPTLPIISKPGLFKVDVLVSIVWSRM